MAKYYGKIGFVKEVEKSPGVIIQDKTERLYKGNIIHNRRRYETSDKINDDVNINVSISIISDSYAIDNIYAIKYVSWMNNLWKVTDIDIERPRITLTLGGLYNG